MYMFKITLLNKIVFALGFLQSIPAYCFSNTNGFSGKGSCKGKALVMIKDLNGGHGSFVFYKAFFDLPPKGEGCRLKGDHGDEGKLHRSHGFWTRTAWLGFCTITQQRGKVNGLCRHFGREIHNYKINK